MLKRLSIKRSPRPASGPSRTTADDAATSNTLASTGNAGARPHTGSQISEDTSGMLNSLGLDIGASTQSPVSDTQTSTGRGALQGTQSNTPSNTGNGRIESKPPVAGTRTETKPRGAGHERKPSFLKRLSSGVRDRISSGPSAPAASSSGSQRPVKPTRQTSSHSSYADAARPSNHAKSTSPVEDSRKTDRQPKEEERAPSPPTAPFDAVATRLHSDPGIRTLRENGGAPRSSSPIPVPDHHAHPNSRNTDPIRGRKGSRQDDVNGIRTVSHSGSPATWTPTIPGSGVTHSLPNTPARPPAALELDRIRSRTRSGRSSTSPLPSHVFRELPRNRKRLVLCCDGTWQDGITSNRKWKYSNVLRLSRCVAHEDVRHHPPIPQIVFYQSGLGTSNLRLGQIMDGAFGTHLAEKVQEAYAWVAQNYQHHDEIMLFGFSRGAYTARMVALLIGEIGLLTRSQMDDFEKIFVAYQKRGKTTNPDELAELDKFLEPYRNKVAEGQRKFHDCKFSVKVIGVFDTVGALGLPTEFTKGSKKMKDMFNFPDTQLGIHIEKAYHAMALDEERADFNVTKYRQTQEGKDKGQTLRQMWFSGSHSDVGGGYQDHDLSDISLVWMLAEVGDILAIDMKYLKSIPQPVRPWGKQTPHYSAGGFFALGGTIERQIEPMNVETQEKVHRSVREQAQLPPSTLDVLKTYTDVVEDLWPLEQEIQVNWRYTPGDAPDREDEDRARTEKKREEAHQESVRKKLKKAGHTAFVYAGHALENGGAEAEHFLDRVTGHERDQTRAQHEAEQNYDFSSMGQVYREIMSRPD